MNSSKILCFLVSFLYFYQAFCLANNADINTSNVEPVVEPVDEVDGLEFNEDEGDTVDSEKQSTPLKAPPAIARTSSSRRASFFSIAPAEKKEQSSRRSVFGSRSSSGSKVSITEVPAPIAAEVRSCESGNSIPLELLNNYFFASEQTGVNLDPATGKVSMTYLNVEGCEIDFHVEQTMEKNDLNLEFKFSPNGEIKSVNEYYACIRNKFSDGKDLIDMTNTTLKTVEFDLPNFNDVNRKKMSSLNLISNIAATRDALIGKDQQYLPISCEETFLIGDLIDSRQAKLNDFLEICASGSIDRIFKAIGNQALPINLRSGMEAALNAAQKNYLTSKKSEIAALMSEKLKTPEDSEQVGLELKSIFESLDQYIIKPNLEFLDRYLKNGGEWNKLSVGEKEVIAQQIKQKTELLQDLYKSISTKTIAKISAHGYADIADYLENKRLTLKYYGDELSRSMKKENRADKLPYLVAGTVRSKYRGSSRKIDSSLKRFAFDSNFNAERRECYDGDEDCQAASYKARSDRYRSAVNIAQKRTRESTERKIKEIVNACSGSGYVRIVNPGKCQRACPEFGQLAWYGEQALMQCSSVQSIIAQGNKQRANYTRYIKYYDQNTTTLTTAYQAGCRFRQDCQRDQEFDPYSDPLLDGSRSNGYDYEFNAPLPPGLMRDEYADNGRSPAVTGGGSGNTDFGAYNSHQQPFNGRLQVFGNVVTF